MGRSDFTDSGVPVLTIGCLTHHGIDLSKAMHVSPEKAASLQRYQLRHGDLLFSRMATVGRASIVERRFEGALFNYHLMRLRLLPEVIDPRLFVYYVHGSQMVRDYVQSVNHGATRDGINTEQLLDLPVLLPPPVAQPGIVAAIESHFSRLDAATATLERVQRNLERYRASVLKAAVEGRLVPTEAELAKKEGRSYEPASVLLKRILAERRRRWEEAELAKLTAKGKKPTDDKWKAKYVEPSAPNLAGLPELPEGWCWASIAQLITHLTSGSRDWTDYYDRGTGVFLMAQNVRPGRLDLGFVQRVDPPANDASRSRSQVEEGDLLVTIVGANTGDVCRVPRSLPEHFVCQSVALMRPVERSLSRYLDAYLNSPPGQAVFERFMYGQGRPHLGFEHLESTPVPLPPSQEADRIVNEIDDAVSIADAATGPLAANVARIARLRQSILKWAFEGRLVDQRDAEGAAANPRAGQRRRVSS